MKYCNNCGNRLQDEQKFCDKCGQNVDIKKNNINEHTYTSANYNSQAPKNNNSGKIVMIIVLILITLLLLGGLLFGAYKLFLDNDDSISNNSNSNSYDESNNSEDEDYPSINVLSETFSTNFMNQDRRNGFGYVNLGMSKSEIDNKFGNSEGNVNIAGISAKKYGNIAIQYNKNTVSRYFIIPDDLSIYQFEDYHGDPTMKADEGGVIYDDNAHNSYTIKVYVNESGKVIGIENVDQIARNDSDTSDNDEVDSKYQAKNLADAYLTKNYEDYWIHSVDEYNGVYRVNYGEGNASHAHDAVYIDQENGKITETDPNE